jgi:hypothetical protein
VVDQPRLVEVARTEDAASLAGLLEAVVPRAFVPAESNQATQGGANPRFGSIFDAPAPAEMAAGDVRNCAIVSERADVTAAVRSALEARSIACYPVTSARNFNGAARALRVAVDATAKNATAVGADAAAPPEPMDAVVVVLAGNSAAGSVADAPRDWQSVLADHHGLVANLQADAAWTRAAADYAEQADRPVRIVTITDATTPGGRSRAQSSAQIARVAAGTTDGRVTALAVSMESAGGSAAEQSAELVGHLLGHRESGAALAGAELVVGTGWIGLRAHPRPIGTLVYGGPQIPGWMDGALREIVGGTVAGEAP